MVSGAVAVVLAAVLSGVMALLILRSRDGAIGVVLPRVFASFILPAGYALLAWRLSPEHRAWKVPLAGCLLAALCIGAVLSETGISDWLMHNLLLAAVLWLVSGGMTLYLYLRRTERLTGESE